MTGRKRTVVCIEDDPDMIALIDLMLKRADVEVIGAIDGEQGLEAIRNSKPDLVLLDLMLPGIDGWEVYQQMKTEDELRDIPVIVVTARAQTIDKVIGLHIAKVDDYLTKPLGPQQLRRSVDRVLGRAM